MKLSVPYIPNEKYTIFLKNKTLNLESIYFSLHSGPVLDSRMRFQETGLQELSNGLQSFKAIKKYCLLNSRFIHPDLYHNSNFLNQILDTLEYLVSHSTLTGLVFSDAYFLSALAAEKRDIISCLEAVPGINCMIDTSQKAFSFLDFIEKTGFKIPEKIILDRSLNRDLKQLEKTGKKIKQQFPFIKVELLANEGCIYHCPFKLAHDAQISFSNSGNASDKTFQINASIGCYPYFYQAPEKFFKSPFIRPEDLNRYKGMADTIKLCGRTLGIKFLSDCITAYSGQSYNGNLLNLMDATHWLSDHYHIDNKKLDPDFFNVLTSCTKECKNCKLCCKLFLKTTINKPMKIKQYKDCL